MPNNNINWENGVIYLIHFDRPYKHASHYLGYASDFEKRMERHKKGRGSNLIKVIQDAGIGWRVVRKWTPCSPKVEAELKRYHNNRALCPICSPRYYSEKAENLKETRRLKSLARADKERHTGNTDGF